MLSLFISFEVLQIHVHSNDINFLLNYSFKVGNKADLQRGRRYLAAKDGDWLDRDYPKDEIPVRPHTNISTSQSININRQFKKVLECSARDNCHIRELFQTVFSLSSLPRLIDR